MKFTSFVKSSALKRVGAVSLTLALGAGLVGCGGNGAGGAVAATVNGQNIMEQTVTDYVAQFRADSGLESDEAWGEWMVANNYTPETVREEVIEYYVKQDLYDQAAAEYNVAVEQADIDEAMEQTKAMLASVQSYSKIPLILTCDEEGGRVNRLMHTIGTTYVGPMLDYKDQGPDKAAENARTIAADLRGCGFNMDLAPVADVWSNRANTVIGDRAYSDDFDQAAQLVSAAVGGFHEGGVACTLKHFPGHGDTSADSHYGSVYVYKTLDELRGAELVPFRAGIEAGADAVMLGHLIMAGIDEQPALFSHAVVTGLLREELGFEGVAITDDLAMGAVGSYAKEGSAAVLAVLAGNDMIVTSDFARQIPQVVEAVNGGTIDKALIDRAVERVLGWKYDLGLLGGVV